MTVLWATHLTDEVQDSDRLMILHEGALLADGQAQEIKGNQSLKDHFLQVTA